MNSRYIIIFVPVFCFFSLQGNAQLHKQYWRNPLSVSVGLEYTGLTYGYHYSPRGVLARNGYGAMTFQQASFNINLLYAPTSWLGVELGLQNTEMDLGVTDRKFISDHNLTTNDYSYTNTTSAKISHTSIQFLGCFDEMAYYTSPHMSLFYYPGHARTIRPYFGAGISLNYIHSPRTMYAEWNADTLHESLQLKTSFPSVYTSFTLETGIQIAFKGYNKGGFILYTGLKYYFSGQRISGDYTNMDLNSGALNYSDHVTAGMSYLAFTTRIGFGVATKTKQQHKHYAFKEKPVHHSTQPTPIPQHSTPVEKTTLQVQHRVVVHSKDLRIKIWDRGMEDNDVLTFKLNNIVLLNNYTLTKDGKELTVHLNEGDNHFILEAVSLGEFPPCTVAITIDDGVKQQTFDLNSDFNTSGAVNVFVQ